MKNYSSNGLMNMLVIQWVLVERRCFKIVVMYTFPFTTTHHKNSTNNCEKSCGRSEHEEVVVNMIRSSCHVNRNMTVERSAGSSSKNFLEHIPFHHHLSYYVVLRCWIMSFFPVLFIMKKLERLNTIWDSSDYIIWNVSKVFDIYNSNHPKLWTMALHQRFGRFMMCLIYFLSV